jgi:hypothetical protein
MYGINDQAATDKAPARGRTHFCIMATEQPGQSVGAEGQDFRRNGTKDCSRAAILIEGVDAKSCQFRDLEREIRLQEFFVVLALLVIHDVVHHAIDVFVSQRRHVDTLHVTIDTNHGRNATRKMQVRCVVFHRKGQQLGNVDGHRSPSELMTAGLTITRPDGCLV